MKTRLLIELSREICVLKIRELFFFIESSELYLNMSLFLLCQVKF